MTAPHQAPIGVVAIDGPAGAGKSTVARALAGRLGVEYLDTGAMYRAVAFACLQRGIDPRDQHAVAAALPAMELQFTPDRVVVDGVDATAQIRGRAVTDAVTPVAANPAVRTDMVRRQREWGHARAGSVIEGRDIGSVVFPDAATKVYLTASPRVRAERRVAQSGGDLAEIEASIAARDAADAGRAHGPLVEAAGAVVVDTSGLTTDEVLDEIERTMGRR